MRLLPLLLLAACYDGATTTITLDVKTGAAHVVQQLHNAWPDAVGCDDVPEGDVDGCVAAIRNHLDEARADLVEKGATVTATGLILADGELDLRFDYVAPVGSATLSEQGLVFAWLEDRSSRQVEKDRPGKRRLAMFTLPISTGKNTTEIDGRYRLLSGAVEGEPISVHLFKGKTATVVSEWAYAAEEGTKSPGAWLREWPGLEEALRATGLVVEPPAAPI